jgi:hypothetical protein
MVEQSDESGKWQGKLTELINAEGATPHYSAIVKLLVRSGAAEQIRRGGGAAPSEWQVFNPEADLGAAHRGMFKAPVAQDRIDRLEQLVGGVNVPLALAELARDIAFVKHVVIGGADEDTSE